MRLSFVAMRALVTVGTNIGTNARLQRSEFSALLRSPHIARGAAAAGQRGPQRTRRPLVVQELSGYEAFVAISLCLATLPALHFQQRDRVAGAKENPAR